MGDLANFLLPNEPTCIVACSAAEARLWRSTSRFGEWQYLTCMSNPSATAREASFSSDRQGRSFDSFGAGRHAMSQAKSGHEQELQQFARQVAKYLNRSIANADFAHIVLIAAPRFLGCLRIELSDAARRALVLEESKNLTDLDDDAIKKYFE
ncbi:MAG: host attachment protein [Gammaproteobacteria bacterium]|nr:host attachment protein [Gammaproteobacteria bacterium]